MSTKKGWCFYIEKENPRQPEKKERLSPREAEKDTDSLEKTTKSVNIYRGTE